jgi:ABC-2 type transport system permease protein
MRGNRSATNGMNTLVAFIKKDICIETSYRFNLLMRITGILFYTATFYFISRLLTYTDYFSFVLIGIAVSNYLTTALTVFSQAIRDEQLSGTLEAMAVTPASLFEIIIYSSIGKFIGTTLEVASYLAAGIIIFGMRLAYTQLAGAGIIVILTILCCSALGILSASFIMVFKRGDPIHWFIGSAFQLLGGVFFPLSVLPAWLQDISRFIPLTYSLHGLRGALLEGLAMGQMLPDIKALLLFCIVLLPVSLVAFSYAIRRTKIDGSLGHY